MSQQSKTGSLDTPTISFDLRFFVTESEWREASALVHPIIANRFVKPLVRVFNGCAAVFIFMVPGRFGSTWPDLLRYSPHHAGFLLVVALGCAWTATGIGVKSLNHHVNRLDRERHIVVSDQGLSVTLGERHWNHHWKDFVFFRDTPKLIVLRATGTRFWTIPTRAIPPADVTPLPRTARRETASQTTLVMVIGFTH
jgi:YcxB-like protein